MAKKKREAHLSVASSRPFCCEWDPCLVQELRRGSYCTLPRYKTTSRTAWVNYILYAVSVGYAHRLHNPAESGRVENLKLARFGPNSPYLACSKAWALWIHPDQVTHSGTEPQCSVSNVLFCCHTFCLVYLKTRFRSTALRVSLDIRLQSHKRWDVR